MRPAPALGRESGPGALPAGGGGKEGAMGKDARVPPEPCRSRRRPRRRLASSRLRAPSAAGGLRRAWRAGRQFFYGMTTFEWVRGLERERGEAERLFLLVTFGGLVGLPILPPYYTLRLLPHVLPVVQRWKRGLLRERDWTDLAGLIGGID